VLDPKQWPEGIQNYFDIRWDRNKKFVYKTSFEWKRDETEFPRIPGGGKNSGQII
jgi:hypothetical protein